MEDENCENFMQAYKICKKVLENLPRDEQIMILDELHENFYYSNGKSEPTEPTENDP